MKHEQKELNTKLRCTNHLLLLVAFVKIVIVITIIPFCLIIISKEPNEITKKRFKIILCQSVGIKNRRAMFVMLSVRTTTVCERQAETTGKEKVTIENIYINNNSIEKTFTKSISFDKNINKSNLLLTELNNFKQPPTLQVFKIEEKNIKYSLTILHVILFENILYYLFIKYNNTYYIITFFKLNNSLLLLFHNIVS